MPFVEWAAVHGIVSGFEDNTFRPYDIITHEQIAAMLMNYIGFMDFEFRPVTNPDVFVDVGSISWWARDAVETG